MQVRIDGKIVERAHTICHLQSGDRRGFGHCLPIEEPELYEGEKVLWMLDDPIPMIVRTYDPT